MLHTTKENLLQNSTLVLLVLAGMNVGNRYFYFLCMAAAVFFLFKRSIRIDLNTLLLLILSGSWILFSPDTDTLSVTALVKPLLYPLTYLIGRNFFRESRQNFENEYIEARIRFFIIMIASGPYIHYILNYIENSGFDMRNTIDIWTGTILSATGQAVLACMMLSVTISVVVASSKMTAKLISAAVIASILMYNLILAGRTIWGIAILIVTLSVVYLYRELSRNTERLKIILVALLILALLYVMYVENIFGIRTVVQQSNFFRRFFKSFQNTEDLLADRRMDIKIEYLKNFKKGLFGGREIFKSGMGYAHDLFLDTYDEAGIFALFAVVTFTVGAVFTLIRCLKARYLSLYTRLMLFNIYATVMLIFMLEPILQGTPWLFLSFCFIHGVLVEVDMVMKEDFLDSSLQDERDIKAEV